MNTADRRPNAGTILAAALAALALSGCSADDPPTEISGSERIGGPDRLTDEAEPPADLKNLRKHARESGLEDTEVLARERALREDALRFGSWNGYRRRAWEIRERLETRSAELSVIYDFNRVARPAPERTGYLLPPVIARSRDAFEAEPGGETVSAADEYYEILRNAAFSPTPPTWRGYLLFHADEKPRRDRLRVTRSTAERKKQDAWIREGWLAGVKQAGDELALRLRRLKRDFEGMLEYRRLQALGMISPPETYGAEFGVTGSAGHMRVGDRTAKIIRHADFRRDHSGWRRVPQ